MPDPIEPLPDLPLAIAEAGGRGVEDAVEDGFVVDIHIDQGKLQENCRWSSPNWVEAF